MTKLYLFDADRACFCECTWTNLTMAQEMAERNGAHSYLLSEEAHTVDQVYAGPDGELLLIPARPHAHAVFAPRTGQWFDPRTLQDHKDAQWARVKQARAHALAAPLITPYGVFDADPVASANIIKSVLLANNLTSLGYPVAIDFTLHDNRTVVLDGPAMVQAGLLLAAREQGIRAQATSLRAQIEAALDEAQVAAARWPAE